MDTVNLTKKRMEEYLEKGKRFDKRELLEMRELTIETGIVKNAEGSARVKLGKTEVVAGVKMDVGEPYTDSPDKGNLTVTVELLPLSSSDYESGPPKFDSIEIARIIDRGIRESGFIDFEKLCIKEGEKVWNVFVDLYPINDAGNVLDALGLAAIAAIKSAVMVKYDEKTEKVQFGEFTTKKLPIKEELIPVNFTFYKIGKNIILDPTTTEEGASDGRISIAFSKREGKPMINSVQKSEIMEFGLEEMNNVLDTAEETFKKHGDKIIKMIK